MNNNQRIGLTYASENGQRTDEPCIDLEIIKVGDKYVATYKNEKNGLFIGSYASLEEAKEFLKGLL